jgi:hypothetical protein
MAIYEGEHLTTNEIPQQSAIALRMIFACVNDAGVPAETIDLLRDACMDRNIAFLEVNAREFDYDPSRRLVAGDLMYRSATSMAAIRAEQFLYAPGVATFYMGADDRLFFIATTQWLHFQRAGLLVPETLFCAAMNRPRLDGWVARLGGFPILAKMGGSAGIGVILIDSPSGLYSFVDYALSLGRQPALTRYIRDAVHWRVVVVGGRVIAAFTTEAPPGDFRAHAHNRAGSFTDSPPAAIATLAIDAVRVTRLEFGGVDILERSDGCYVLESNFPCYFARAQVAGGIDTAGAMVDHLMHKAAGTSDSN